MKRSIVAKDLRTPKYRCRVVEDKKKKQLSRKDSSWKKEVRV